ncbi:hypothetical protein H072_1645 [Dactylellina haptotyla CBS 200.50]|uniref:Rhodopsin domain-containing protein n=1 Tax=Dactylellina haptotyla (strain CBS 200.50) TaxID=1284197 RepID=S8AN67_DACHA|nr:hypothetical protein H072_1645 [Dactylellina haptotyla CBS 200.50]
MANPVNITRLLELAARQDIVRKAGLLPVVIPDDVLKSQVLNPSEKNRCSDPVKEVVALTIIGIVTDLMLFLLPLTVVWRLSLELKQKIMVSGLFLIGALACIASGIRLYYLIIFYHSFDRTFTSMVVNALGHIEIALGLVTACLPMMRQAIILLPKGNFYSQIFSLFRRKRRRRQGGSIRIQKIDSRSTKLTTADQGTMLQDLSASMPSPQRETFLQQVNSRPRRDTASSSTRQNRIARDIAREGFMQASRTSSEPPDIDTMWIMIDGGPVRVPIRFQERVRDRGF